MITTRKMGFSLLAIASFALMVLFTLVNCGGGGGGGTAPAAKTSVKLAQTGQASSYPTPTSHDDGFYKTGVAWPSPRFTAASSGTGTVVTDNLTGLMWQERAKQRLHHVSPVPRQEHGRAR